MLNIRSHSKEKLATDSPTAMIHSLLQTTSGDKLRWSISRYPQRYKAGLNLLQKNKTLSNMTSLKTVVDGFDAGYSPASKPLARTDKLIRENYFLLHEKETIAQNAAKAQEKKKSIFNYYKSEFSAMEFPLYGTGRQYQKYLNQGKMLQNFFKTTGSFKPKITDMIHKKSAAQNIEPENISKKIEKIVQEKIQSQKMNYDLKKKEVLPGTRQVDINIVTDRVYKMLERRILIERERRGMK